MRGVFALPKAAYVGTAISVAVLLLVSAAPVAAQSGTWNLSITYAPTLQVGDNQLITVITSSAGSLNTPSAVNGTLITPLGTAVNLTGFITVSNGISQTVFHVPDELGTYYFTVTLYNGTDTATAYGTFGAITNDASALNSIQTGVSANSGALATLQSTVASDNAALQSSIASLGSAVTASTNAIQGTLASLGTSVGSQINAQTGTIQNSFGALSSTVSSLSPGINSANNNASEASFYALGALVVALLALIVAAFGATRKR